MMDAKEYLKQVKLYDTHINSLIEEKAQLESLAFKVTSSWGSEPVSGGGNQDKLGDTTSKIIDLEKAIDAEIDLFVDKKAEVKSVIQQVTNPDHLKLLLDVYIHYKTLAQASCDMGYSYRQTCNIHGKALQAVEEVLRCKNGNC